MIIAEVWRYRTEPDRIHYRLLRADGTMRHLFVDRSAKGGLFKELEDMAALKLRLAETRELHGEVSIVT